MLGIVAFRKMLNIRLANKSLFLSPSCSENPSNKAMKVQPLWFWKVTA